MGTCMYVRYVVHCLNDSTSNPIILKYQSPIYNSHTFIICVSLSLPKLKGCACFSAEWATMKDPFLQSPFSTIGMIQDSPFPELSIYPLWDWSGKMDGMADFYFYSSTSLLPHLEMATTNPYTTVTRVRSLPGHASNSLPDSKKWAPHFHLDTQNVKWFTKSAPTRLI